MPQAPIPFKTPLGQDAVRKRTGELGQRHRTLLFLIDGRRTLAEVLGLAHQAGAATTHFEDLVRLGYVQLPEEPPEPAPAPVAALPEPAEPPAEPQITHLEVEVPGPAAPAAPAEPAEPSASVFADTMPMPPPAPPAPAAPARTKRAAKRPPAPPPTADDEASALERARACLLETLRVDPQPASSRIAERARQARDTPELIEVVWVMERGLTHSQRSHRGLLNLQKARELLGLGNTLVDEDSRPGIPGDDEW